MSSQCTAHVEPVDLPSSPLRIYAPGKSYAAKDPFIASASVVWITPTTVELRAMSLNRYEDGAEVSMAAARGAIREALLAVGAKSLRFERYRDGVGKLITIDIETNRIIQ